MKETLYALLFLVLGFILLIKGADFFVEGSSSVAKKLQIPSIIIGMTIVAMGTSLPECAVSVTASLSNNNELAISNVLGSNMFNLLVVCGACALFVPLKVQKNTLKREFPFSVLCTVVLMGIGYVGMQLGRGDGILLLAVFILYILYMVRSALQAKGAAQGEEDYAILPGWKCALFIVGGAIAIKYGGDFVVSGASTIAASFGISQNIIGLTVVALGTSLPELVTSLVAARKDEVDMAVGNVIGSNIFNILLILGIAASISPVGVNGENLMDAAILVIVSVIVWFFARSKEKIVKKEGIAMLGMYLIYLVYICMR
jgi:cation:H+ antiporter